MTILLSNGRSRATSAEITVENDQILTLTLTYDSTENTRPIIVERKNSKNEFKKFTLSDGTFCQLDNDSPAVEIVIPGVYRVVRQDCTAYDLPDNNIGVSYTLAVNFGSTNPDQTLSTTRSGKDVNNVYTTIEFFRSDSSLAKTSILSGGTSPEYTTRTETWYEADGVTVASITIYTLSYTDGDLVSETLAVAK